MRPIIFILLVFSLFLFLTPEAFCISNAEIQNFEQSIIDYRSKLNPYFNKIKRKVTKYIIVHTSECSLRTTLKLISKGKQDNYKWVTQGGHAHYVIARDGTTYFTLDEKYKAHHAGRSMWNGKTSLNSSSIGVEFVAYHDKEISIHQYQSARILIGILKERYGLSDSAVLTHSQVAYSKQNQWNKLDHRGRKHCAQNFDRIRAGLGYTWQYDPDVKAGRLQADPKLASIFYGLSSKGTLRGIANVIDQESTILAIAGEKYDSPNTLYKLPDGWVISGNRIENRIGWHHIPAGTKIILY